MSFQRQFTTESPLFVSKRPNRGELLRSTTKGVNIPSYSVRRTHYGLRLLQHGAVLSELRTTTGATHSVFDLLAAVIALHASYERKSNQSPRLGVLGFAGGGMMAPLRGLQITSPLETCDVDTASYNLFLHHCPQWARQVRWQNADAVSWLQRSRKKFDLLMDDLSISDGGEVIKPPISWNVLPGLFGSRLNRGGWAIFNLMSPENGRWRPALRKIKSAMHQPDIRLIRLEAFENQILIAAKNLPTARVISFQLRKFLHQLQSRQATRFTVHGTGLC
jgi:hypothetical protein